MTGINGKKAISIALAAIIAASSVSTAIAQEKNGTAFTNGHTLADILGVTKSNTEQSTGLLAGDYTSNSTLQYFSTLINKMSVTSSYRLALEKVYGNALTVENVAASSESIWGSINGDVLANPDAYNVINSGNTTEYINTKSMSDVLSLMKYTTTEAQYNSLANASTPAELFKRYSEISSQNGTGGTYYWTDTTYTGGGHKPAIGDTVLFTITATLGSKSVEGSYTQLTHASIGPKQYQDKSSYTVVPGGSVSFSYIGTVLEVDAGGAHAAMGTVDLSGLGAVGDAYLAAKESGGQLVGAHADANGNMTYDVPAEPPWNITFSTSFSHNTVDIQKIIMDTLRVCRKDGGMLVDSAGNPLTIDLSESDFVARSLEKGYYSNEQEALSSYRMMRAEYVIGYMENILGYPPALSVAFALVMNNENGGTMDPAKIQDNGPGRGLCQWEDRNLLNPNGEYYAQCEDRWNIGVNWCVNNGYDMNTLEGQLQFLNHEMKDQFPNLLEQCMTTYSGDFAGCVDEIVRFYEFPAYPDAEIHEIVTGIDSTNKSYYEVVTDKSLIWVAIHEAYSDVINQATIYNAPIGLDEMPESSLPEESAMTADRHIIASGENMSVIAHSYYSEIDEGGTFSWDKDKKLRVDLAIANINNRYVEEHPDAGYESIDVSGEYPVLYVGATMYIPTIDEIYKELGIITENTKE